jgi:bacteriorhodopsin
VAGERGQENCPGADSVGFSPVCVTQAIVLSILKQYYYYYYYYYCSTSAITIIIIIIIVIISNNARKVNPFIFTVIYFSTLTRNLL